MSGAPAIAEPDIRSKLEVLREIVRGYESVLVAFSGGVDSALVLRVCADELGDRATALTAVSASVPGSELALARSYVQQLGLTHVVEASHELEDPRYAANPVDRCFFCKENLYVLADARARDLGLARVVDGTQVDDLSGHRPGLAAAEQRKVASPLVEAGLGKTEVRVLAKALGVPMWARPAQPCLASRIPYGTPVTSGRLSQVEQAEAVVRRLGFTDVRVRHHGDIARVEVPVGDIPRIVDADLRDALLKGIKEAGFAFVTLDLAGYRSGSLLESIIP
jgi:uncharacterized protein